MCGRKKRTDRAARVRKATSISLALFLLVIGVWASVQQLNISLAPNPNNPTEALVNVSVIQAPDFARINSASWSGNGSSGTAIWNLASPPVLAMDKMQLRIHLEDSRVVIACFGTAFIPGICGPNQAAIIDTTGLTAPAVAPLVVTGASVSATFSGDFSETVALWATSGYELPLPGGSDPFGGSNSLYMGCASSWPFEAAPLMVVLSFYNSPGQGRVIPIPAPRPKPRIPPTGVSQPGDINGDGHNDFKFPGDWPVPGLGDVLVGFWAIDKPPYGPSASDYLVIVIGHDLNHNGVLEASEVTQIIGQCAFIPGFNGAIYENVGGVVYIHWINADNADPSKGHVRHFIYNTSTGLLKVYNEDGQLIYSGPANGYPWGSFQTPWGAG